MPSKDGSVKIPMFIVHHKDVVLDGSNPTYLYAYGGGNDYSPFLLVHFVIYWHLTSSWAGHTYVRLLSGHTLPELVVQSCFTEPTTSPSRENQDLYAPGCTLRSILQTYWARVIDVILAADKCFVCRIWHSYRAHFQRQPGGVHFGIWRGVRHCRH